MRSAKILGGVESALAVADNADSYFGVVAYKVGLVSGTIYPAVMNFLCNSTLIEHRVEDPREVLGTGRVPITKSLHSTSKRHAVTQFVSELARLTHPGRLQGCDPLRPIVYAAFTYSSDGEYWGVGLFRSFL